MTLLKTLKLPMHVGRWLRAIESARAKYGDRLVQVPGGTETRLYLKMTDRD